MLLPGLVSITFRPLSPEQIIAHSVANGLRGIEWGGDLHVPHGDLVTAERVGRLTRGAGLTVSAYGSYFGLSQAGTQPFTFTQVLDSASALQAPTVRIWAGKKASAAASPDDWSRLLDEARACSEQAAARGLTLSLEMHADTYNDSLESTARLLREINHPALLSLWQPLNGASVETCLAMLEAVAPRLSHVHAFHWWPTHRERHPLAEGTDRWRVYLSRLAQISGDRYVSLEFLPGDDLALLPREARTLRTWLDEVKGASPQRL